MVRIAERDMMKININKDIEYILQLVIGLILVTLGVPIRPIMYIAALYCIVMIFFCKDEEKELWLLFGWLGVSNIFNLSAGSFSIFTIIEIIYCLKHIVLNRMFDTRFFLPYFLFVGYILIGTGTNFKDFIKIAMVPLLLYLMTRQINWRCLNKISLGYIIGILYGSIIGLFVDDIPHMNEYMSYELVNVGYTSRGFVTTYRFAGLWGDANYYSVHLILILTIFAIWFRKNTIKPYIFYSAYIVIALFGGLSGSKSFVFAFAVATILIIVTFVRRRPIQALILIVGSISFAFLIYSGYIDAFSRVMYRLNQIYLGNDTLTTGRTEIWNSYIELFKSNNILLLFGSGLEKGFPLRYAHNTYLDFLILLGIFGGLLYTIVLFRTITCTYGNKINGSVLPAIMLLVMYFFLSMFYSLDFVFEIVIGFGFLLLGIEKEENLE